VALQSFSHVGVCVSDLERSTAFYEGVLGFRPLFTMTFGGELEATMEIDGTFESRMLVRDDVLVELLHWIEPEATGDGERRPMDRFGMTHLCFRVDDVDDLVDVAEQLGGTAHRHTRTVLAGQGVDGGDVTLLYLTDPDGTRIELMAGSPDLRPR
jgi:glyoxylase I family protein